MDSMFSEKRKTRRLSPDKITIPSHLPLLPLRDVVLFTHMLLPLLVGRERSVSAVQGGAGTHRLLFLAAQKESTLEDPGPEDIHELGTVAAIMRTSRGADGSLKVLVQGLCKARILKYVQENPHFEVALTPLQEAPLKGSPSEIEALMRTVREQSLRILSLKGLLNPDVMAILNQVDDPGKLADLVASNLQLKSDEVQRILEVMEPGERLRRVSRCLDREMAVSTIQARIQSEAKEEIGRMQRDYYLREQIRVIRRELGELGEKSGEKEALRAKVQAARMPRQAKKEAYAQLERLEQMPPEAAESSIIRTYLDWLIELPWKHGSRDLLDMKRAQRILDEDHYDLKEVKDRILEYLSVRKLNPASKGPILCFIGPPGTGKTSLGKSIARALGRKFTRISVGGVRDEAEIRGHRRTYIGALPGRILQGIRQTGHNNPVFMIDEIDKIGQDFRGDPSSALLEVLDPEQNRTFSDHYLNIPFDLSKVLFIATGNMEETIPPPLLDRMEVIRLSGYTFEEKLTIAERYLLPRQLKETGIPASRIHLSTGALREIIAHYTEEAGVRNLEREIGAVCRKVARRLAEGETGPFRITRRNVHRYLGPPKYLQEPALERDEVGVATGLAWTESGGEILYVEASLMRGKGEVFLTGQLGDVMKESAQTALSYARIRSEELGIDLDFFEKQDIHVHVPAGAIPKDGPSAGITIAAAMISALSRTPLKRTIAMTGEITLRGQILPVGGLKEKILAACRRGIETVLFPKKNLRDVSEIPAEIRRKITLKPVSHMDEILELAFVRSPLRGRGGHE